MITIIEPSEVKTLGCGCIVEYTSEHEISGCTFCGAHRVLYAKLRAIEIKNPPDLGVHVTDGIKPEMKVGD